MEDEFVWGEYSTDKNGKATFKTRDLDIEVVPNVTGMGAKDAIYLMQERGLNVQVEGYGRVKSQSIVPGTKAIKGEAIRLILANT